MIESLYVFSAHSTQSVWRLYMIKIYLKGLGAPRNANETVLVIKQIDCYIGYLFFVLTEQ